MGGQGGYRAWRGVPPRLLIPIYTHRLTTWDMSGLNDGILLKYQSHQVRIIYELDVTEKIRHEFLFPSKLVTDLINKLSRFCHNYCSPLEISTAKRPLE